MKNIKTDYNKIYLSIWPKRPHGRYTDRNQYLNESIKYKHDDQTKFTTFPSAVLQKKHSVSLIQNE